MKLTGIKVSIEEEGMNKDILKYRKLSEKQEVILVTAESVGGWELAAPILARNC